jgi:hypothetical protein
MKLTLPSSISACGRFRLLGILAILGILGTLTHVLPVRATGGDARPA